MQERRSLAAELAKFEAAQSKLNRALFEVGSEIC
jgi:hypothetical protein